MLDGKWGNVEEDNNNNNNIYIYIYILKRTQNGMIHNSCFVIEKEEKDISNNNEKDKIETKCQEEG